MIVTNSLTGGGAERSMNLASNELFRRGWSVSLVPINSSPPDQVVPVCEVFPLERQWKGSLVGTLVALRKFYKVVKSWDPDVIVLNCDLPELFGATLLSKRKLVVIEHVDRPWKTRIIFGWTIRKLLNLRNTKWAAVSNHFAIWPELRVPDAVLPNAIVQMGTLLRRASPLTQADKVRRLVFIGRLAPQKRPDWLLDIGKNTNFPVEIIGEGSMQESMQDFANNQSLKINFRGRIREPWREIKDGDLLIIPSEYEGDGLVVIEGIQQGLPMLIADIPDFRRFGFPDRNYCKNVEDFVDAIGIYSNNLSALLIPEQISEQILVSRSLTVVGNNWEEFLSSI